MEPESESQNLQNEATDPVPLMQERLRGNVFNDFIVPRYSALSTAEPRPIVIIGVWLLMVPSALCGLLVMWSESASQTPLMRLMKWTAMLLIAGLQLWVVIKTTRRRGEPQNMENEATE